jgi:hypothetical protein
MIAFDFGEQKIGYDFGHGNWLLPARGEGWTGRSGQMHCFASCPGPGAARANQKALCLIALLLAPAKILSRHARN